MRRLTAPSNDAFLRTPAQLSADSFQICLCDMASEGKAAACAPETSLICLNRRQKPQFDAKQT